MSFVFDKGKDNPDKYLCPVKLSGIQTNKVFYGKLTFIRAGMPEFIKSREEFESRFDNGSAFSGTQTELRELSSGVEEDSVFRRFFEQAKTSGQNAEERALVPKKPDKSYRGINSVIGAAREEGPEKGLRRVDQRAGKRGGRRKALATACDMPAENIPAEVIGRANRSFGRRGGRNER